MLVLMLLTACGQNTCSYYGKGNGTVERIVELFDITTYTIKREDFGYCEYSHIGYPMFKVGDILSKDILNPEYLITF